MIKIAKMDVTLRNVSRFGQLNNNRSERILLLSKRWKATAAPLENVEFEDIKPFDQVPGARFLPLIGTAWTALPIIGIIL